MVSSTKPMLPNFRKFKMLFPAMFTDLTEGVLYHTTSLFNHSLTFKAINFSQPPYLSSLSESISFSSLYSKEVIGRPALPVAAPVEWKYQIATDHLGIFRSQVKIYLFSLAYPTTQSPLPNAHLLCINLFSIMDFPFLCSSASEYLYGYNIMLAT